MEEIQYAVDRLRVTIFGLDMERKMIQESLLTPRRMIRGSLYHVKRKCGKNNCHCSKEGGHPALCLSMRQDGKAKLVYVKKKDESWTRERIEYYKEFREKMAKIREVNNQILELLKGLRDSRRIRY